MLRLISDAQPGFFLLPCVFIFSKRAVGVSIYFNNMYINGIYSKSHFLNLKTAKKINTIFACLLTAGSSMEHFRAIFTMLVNKLLPLLV